jgi:glycosyltransferase involved in cell wall biosynthesis
MRLISIVTPCFNEEANVRDVYAQVKAVMERIGRYRYEHIFIDNASTDGTVAVLREIAGGDRNVKVIVNTRNFGQVRSPYHAVLQARGDAIIGLAADLQDPPALIADFIARWEDGYKVVLAVKRGGEERWPMSAVRRLYYDLLARTTSVETVKGATGFGLYDRQVIEIIRAMNEMYPYFRGLVAEIGFPIAQIPYDKPLRKRGLTKNNLLSLFDLAMLGLTTHSKAPLRLATIAGFLLSGLSLVVALVYLVAKLVFWSRYPAGVAPLIIGLFATFSVQLFFLGMVGEYIAAIHTHLLRRPIVVERERINFDEPADAHVSDRRSPELAGGADAP